MVFILANKVLLSKTRSLIVGNMGQKYLNSTVVWGSYCIKSSALRFYHYDYSLLVGMISAEALFRVSSASRSILVHSSSHEGISWMSPMT